MYGKLVRTNVNRKVLFYLRSAVPIHQTLFITSARLHLQYRTVCNSVLFIIECAIDVFHKGISNEADWRDNNTQDALAQDLSSCSSAFLSEI